MQAAVVCFTGPSRIKSTKCLIPKRVSSPLRTFVHPKAVATIETESSTVDYNSLTSVFPVEACDIIGGDACIRLLCPEAKLAAMPSTGTARPTSEEVEREYIEYNQERMVFPWGGM